MVRLHYSSPQFSALDLSHYNNLRLLQGILSIETALHQQLHQFCVAARAQCTRRTVLLRRYRQGGNVIYIVCLQFQLSKSVTCSKCNFINQLIAGERLHSHLSSPCICTSLKPNVQIHGVTSDDTFKKDLLLSCITPDICREVKAALAPNFDTSTYTDIRTKLLLTYTASRRQSS